MADPSDQLEDARAFARAYCTKLGDPDALEELRIDLAGPRVMFASLHAGRRGSSISGYLRADRQEHTLATALSRIVRGRARDAAIAASGEAGVPAWSLDIHVVALAMMWNAGVNPLLLASHDLASRDVDDLLQHELAASPLSMEAEIRGGRICMRSASVRPGRGLDDSVVFHEDELAGTPRLTIRGNALPQTALSSLEGHPLATVVSHPLLDDETIRTGATVRSAEMESDSLIIVLNDDRSTIAPPPPGIRTDWLRLPWTP